MQKQALWLSAIPVILSAASIVNPSFALERVVPDQYATIQEAVNASSPNDIITVRAGIYSPSANGEAFPIILSAGLTLRGEDPNTTIINSEDTSARVIQTADETAISGFTIGGDGGGGEWNEVIAVPSSFTTIQNNIILGNGPSYGIYCDSAQNILITQNTFLDWGIYCYSSTQITVSENVFKMMDLYDVGVSLHDSSGNIRNNFIQGGWFGVECYGTAYIQNNVIYDCMYGIMLNSSNSGSVIKNNNVVNIERMGIWAQSDAPITNNIVMNVGDKGIYRAGGEVSYNNLWNNNIDFYDCSNVHDNIFADPLFVDLETNDFHLKSQAGRWNPQSENWIQDEVTSPCIDAGSPAGPVGWEPFPNGAIINIGAYGGTAEASRSYFGVPVCETIVAGDINGDCIVNLLDFAFMAAHWLEDNRSE